MVTSSCFLERRKQSVYTVSVHHQAVSVMAYSIKIIYCDGYQFLSSRENETVCMHGVCTSLGCVCNGLYNLNHILSWLLFHVFYREGNRVYTRCLYTTRLCLQWPMQFKSYIVMVTISCFLERRKQNVYTVSVHRQAVSAVAVGKGRNVINTVSNI